MRDPDLVVRAQRAATELELAWHRWRSMHGLGADPPSPVSSYVGYSLEEPWGQPRVLFGADAAEAEQLAAFLNRHDCAGPVHAAVTGLPGGQQQAALSGAWNRSNGGRVHVPAQGPAAVAERQQPVGQRAGQRDRVPQPSSLDQPSPLDQPGVPDPLSVLDQPSPLDQPSAPDPASSLDTSSRTARPDGRSPQPTSGQDAPVFRAARKAQAAKAAKAARQAPHAEGQHAAQQSPAAEGQQQAPEHPAAAAQHAAEAQHPAGEQQAAAAQQAAEWLQAAQQLQAAQELRAAEEVRAAQELQAAAAHREVQAPRDGHQAAAVPSAPQMQAAGEALTRAASYVQPAESETGLGPALPPGLAAASPVPAPSAPVTSGAAEMQPPSPEGQHAGAGALADEPYQDRYPARGSRISRGRSLPRLPRAKRAGGGPERDLTAAPAPLHASGRKPDSERKTLAAMAAEAARWASQQDPGSAAAEDTAI